MATRTTPRTDEPAERPKITSTEAVTLLLRRCDDFETRLDTLKGRKSAIGRNQNVLAATYLRKVLDAFEDLDYECRLSRVIVHEHNPSGKEPPKEAA